MAIAPRGLEIRETFLRMLADCVDDSAKFEGVTKDVLWRGFCGEPVMHLYNRVMAPTKPIYLRQIVTTAQLNRFVDEVLLERIPSDRIKELILFHKDVYLKEIQSTDWRFNKSLGYPVRESKDEIREFHTLIDRDKIQMQQLCDHEFLVKYALERMGLTFAENQSGEAIHQGLVIVDAVCRRREELGLSENDAIATVLSLISLGGIRLCLAVSDEPSARLFASAAVHAEGLSDDPVVEAIKFMIFAMYEAQFVSTQKGPAANLAHDQFRFATVLLEENKHRFWMPPGLKHFAHAETARYLMQAFDVEDYEFQMTTFEGKCRYDDYINDLMASLAQAVTLQSSHADALHSIVVGAYWDANISLRRRYSLDEKFVADLAYGSVSSQLGVSHRWWIQVFDLAAELFRQKNLATEHALALSQQRSLWQRLADAKQVDSVTERLAEPLGTNLSLVAEQVKDSPALTLLRAFLCSEPVSVQLSAGMSSRNYNE